MDSFTPLRGSSYPALPSDLQGIQSLINVRNHVDNNCFWLCFTAAYNFFHGPPLQTDTWRTVTSPHLYSANNPAAHQSLRTFEMLMGFRDMAASENLNYVQVNVFKYENQQLFLLCLSEQFGYTFILDFCCYKKTVFTKMSSLKIGN